MKKIPFSKPPPSPKEQVALLQNRGMFFSETKNADFYFHHINYYCLGAYWIKPLKKREQLFLGFMRKICDFSRARGSSVKKTINNRF